jgi:hypothetical protein
VPKPIEDDAGHQWTRYADAAELTGVPVGTIHQWVHRGHIATRSVGTVTWVDLIQVQDREKIWRRHRRDTRNRQHPPVPTQTTSGDPVSPQVTAM